MKESKKIYQTQTVSENGLDVGQVVGGLVEDEILTEEQAQNATIIVVQQKTEEEEIVEEEIVEIGKYTEEELQEIVSTYKSHIASCVSDNSITDLQEYFYYTSDGYVIKGYSYTMSNDAINSEFGTQIEEQNIFNKPLEKWNDTDSLLLMIFVSLLLLWMLILRKR